MPVPDRINAAAADAVPGTRVTVSGAFRLNEKPGDVPVAVPVRKGESPVNAANDRMSLNGDGSIYIEKCMPER
jgi:hypothetical protein